MKGDSVWMPATVPGTVHTDLFANKKIPDPFFGDNEKQLQWIEEKDWEYRKTVYVDSAMRKAKSIQIVFEGLDTYADISLDDGYHTVPSMNMFRTKTVHKYIDNQETSFQITVTFSSAALKGKSGMRSNPHELPGEERVHSRKAQYHYGWDWGPRFATCGIWKDVYISTDPYFDTKCSVLTDSVSPDLKKAMLHLHVNGFYPMKNDVQVMLREKGKKEFLLNQPLIAGDKIDLAQEDFYYFSIGNPRLWYCNGYGSPELYDFEILFVRKADTICRRSIRTGIRQVKVKQEKDKAGSSFTVELNGIPVFCKGANYVPPESFLPRATETHKKNILINALAANMNMIRIWGGGIYESEEFYRNCDSLGLMVWQDFMFACALYPDNYLFMDNIFFEFRDNISRLSSHPSIALLCGDNEIDEGWFNWGWQKQYRYSDKDSALLYHSYKVLHDYQRMTIKNEKWNIYFHPSSPSIGWGHPESLRSGDSHYWGVWWGMEPFDVYEKKVPRFSSEYGFQGFPSMLTLKESVPDSSLRLDSPLLKNHQKHPRGFETIDEYMNREYRAPKDFESYAYISQLLQAGGMRKAMEAPRRARPYCMGTLYWQLNDCWPVISWSSLDYRLRWKAVHYAAREAYDQLLVSVTERNDSTLVYLVSDRLKEEKAYLEISICSFDGKTKKKISKAVTANAASSQLVFAFKNDSLLTADEKKNHFLYASFRCGQGCEFSPLESRTAFHYFSPIKNLELPVPGIKLKIKQETNGNFSVTVSAQNLAKNIFIRSGDADIHFSNNYFDLLPGDEKKVYFKSSLSLKELNEKITVMTVRDSY